MKLVVTDLAHDDKDAAVGIGHAVVPFVHIGGKDSRVEPPETINLQFIEAKTIPGDDSRVIVIADFGDSEEAVAPAEMLALFALAPAPKLLDVVEVGSDRNVGFSDIKSPLLGPHTPLLLIQSGHGNGNQAYLSFDMLFVHDDRLQHIDSVFTFGESYCSYERHQDPSFTTIASPGPYRALHVSVLEHVTPTGAECGDEKPPRLRAATYQATYRWDARRQRFATPSKELDRLAKEDAKRF
jgi:hypothetical protein